MYRLYKNGHFYGISFATKKGAIANAVKYLKRPWWWLSWCGWEVILDYHGTSWIQFGAENEAK